MKKLMLTSLVLASSGVSFTAVAVANDPVDIPGFSDVSELLDYRHLADGISEGLSGSAWLDYDNDNDLDLYLVNGIGHSSGLFRNDDGIFTDVTESAGVASVSGNAGVVAGDIDNDGCTDLFLIGAGGIMSESSNGTGAVLYVNNCDGTFSDHSAFAGINPPEPMLMAAFGDIDNDGYIDLFVASPGSFVTGLTPQSLYRNNGDRTFTDISALAGINTANGGCVVTFTDYNTDGLSDIVVGNCNLLDFSFGVPGVPLPGPWELWMNNGDLTFTDMADEAGLNVRPGFAMAMTSADIDRDGDFDLFATGAGVAFNDVYGGILGEQVLFVNEGDGTYTDATYSAGLGQDEWGWGASFADFDNDGDDDLITVGSYPLVDIIGAPLANPGHVYMNNGAGEFTLAATLGVEALYTSGLAVADYSGDGYPDLVINTSAFESELFGGNGAPILLRNERGRHHWLTVKPEGVISNRGGVGAVIEVFDSAASWQWRLMAGRLVPANKFSLKKQVHAGSSFASSESPWPTFGLKHLTSVNIKVIWPSGITELYRDVDADQMITLTEGTGIALP